MLRTPAPLSRALAVTDTVEKPVIEEITNIIGKYDESYIETNLLTAESVSSFAATFYKDVAEIYDTITRIKNVERNPTGYSLADAPILGLLVKIWKLLKEVIRYYEENNADVISLLERPILESAVIATYLMRSTDSVMEDYRKCSYKDRLRILRDLKKGSKFLETAAGKRLLASVQEKLESESFSVDSFERQKKNRWKVDGKTFFDIFSEVESEELYPCTYGMMSESIHSSWNDSMDFYLSKRTDGTFDAYPFSHPADIRYVTPLLVYTNKPYRLWLARINVDIEDLVGVLDWVERVNHALFRRFDETYKEQGDG